MSPLSNSPCRALIVEDEHALADELQDALAQLWPDLHIVDTAADGSSALRLFERTAPNIVFLDIQIPNPNGLEVARLIGDRAHIVFITAYDAFAIEAFERGAVDYVLKPIGLVRLGTTVRRLQSKLQQPPPANLLDIIEQFQPQATRKRPLRWITATVGRTLRLIAIDEVVFFQSDAKYTRVVLADSEVLVKKTLKELMAELDPEQFWQTHRSTVVNALEIASMEPNLAGQLTILLKRRREQLPVSESFVQRFRQM
jgi:DNA-binding LytR/AlgR family response regulator